ncbi:hypothetical protein CJ179_39210 [Rhodococcus sp. ACS1]|uniref:hypothetical protein n=1 Tax=Rhodococcus sp. ACS1 TaxID=2028570 RepID=UPI000BB0E86A|nr:hypothetical protein [Rhodococcus sp. ACS1]PBC38618.1 hypothetical protein CJ179_39210 [Rhodococcus sp. ACS1]
MSTPYEAEGQKKRLAIDLDPHRHTQLTWISQLRGNSLGAEAMNAIDAHIEAAKHDPTLLAKRDQVRAEMEREAKAKQEALTNLFTEAPESPAKAEGSRASGSRPRQRRGQQEGDAPQEP